MVPQTDTLTMTIMGISPLPSRASCRRCCSLEASGGLPGCFLFFNFLTKQKQKQKEKKKRKQNLELSLRIDIGIATITVNTGCGQNQPPVS
jgi:hypothetical protein